METKFLLDSGDPNEYKEISKLAKQKGYKIWGATTNPTLIAKSVSQRISGQKFTPEEAFELQKEIVLKILEIVEGIVSAEVYADQKTLAEQMIKQGRKIASWHKRVAVKLPTTIEGFKARTILRKENVLTNNTLVFSQEQVFAICLHEQIIQNTYKPQTALPPFISPFVGRLDDIGENGMDLVLNSLKIKNLFTAPIWILEASVRSLQHFTLGLKYNVDLITAPVKAYNAFFNNNATSDTLNNISLKPIPFSSPAKELLEIKTIDQFMNTIENGRININHPLTDKGIDRFAKDWQEILR